MRRYEILLPLRFNDRTEVPEPLVANVVGVLRDKFGAVSSESQTIRGIWIFEGEVYRDDTTRLFVDVADTDENKRWFAALKEQLKRDFDQLDIWIISHPIDVL